MPRTAAPTRTAITTAVATVILAAGPLPAAHAAAPPPTDCPAQLHCRLTPAAYALTPNATSPSDYGNYDLANRPADGDAVDSIVIHDTESTAAAAVHAFQQPQDQASAHYVIGRNGGVTQLVPAKDIAWHAGNKYTNMHAIGIEHEGWALNPGSYTEAEYRASATLVRYLSRRFRIPLDRQHLIGHDDVPVPSSARMKNMHWDPGPYWNWNHYLNLLGAPLPHNPHHRRPVPGGTVTITPPYSRTYQPALTGCTKSATNPCPPHPVNFVYLRTAPSAQAPLISDQAMRAAHGPTGTTIAWDLTDKAVAGQTFAVAAVHGDWTAIWYDGQEAWFHNPRNAYAAPGPAASGTRVTPAGTAAVPVYGTAFPEPEAYAAAGTPQPQLTPIPGESILPGQSYPAATRVPVPGTYYYTDSINCSAMPDCILITGSQRWYAIRYNHRLAYVRATDVVPTR